MVLFGGAGHSKEIAKKLGNTGILVGIDRDIDAIQAAKKNLSDFSNVKYIQGNHDDIKDILSEMQIEEVDRNTFRLRSIFISAR